MAAPTLSALYDFEGAFEQAAQTILNDAEINSFISQQGAKLPLINTGISFDTGPALDELTFLPLGVGQSPPPSQEYFRYTGSLEIEVSVNRDTTRQPDQTGVNSFLAQVRSLVRVAFLKSQWPFDDSNLPYLRVSNIRPNGTQTGYDQVRNVDLVTLRFMISFAIQPGAWPVGFPPT